MLKNPGGDELIKSGCYLYAVLNLDTLDGSFSIRGCPLSVDDSDAAAGSVVSLWFPPR